MPPHLRGFFYVKNMEELYEIYKQFPNISIDTRNIQKDCLFFALKGENFDANSFAREALEKGAAWAVVSDPDLEDNDRFFRVKDTLKALQDLAHYHRTQLNIPFLGITGSNGKTTTKELLHTVLSKKYNVLSTPGNYNNHIGVPLTLLSITDEHDFAIIEMGANHIGEIEMLSNISDPDYGIITNIGKAHLKGFGSFEGVKKAKTELYNHISEKKGLVFVNSEDDFLMEVSGDIKRIEYGKGSEFYAEQRSNAMGQIELLIKNEVVSTSLFGDYNFMNLLCAWCVGKFFKVDDKDIFEALSEYNPTNNRSQLIKSGSNTIIMDAYNANPSSMKLALSSFSRLNSENKVLILGDMLELGEEEEIEHDDLIEVVQELGFNNVYLVGKIFNCKNRVYPTFETVSELSEELRNKSIQNSHILIKGSRGIKLEIALDELSNG